MFLRLPFGYRITLDREMPAGLGNELLSIAIRERGASIKLAVPAVNINPRALLLAVVHQERYIEEFGRISMMNDIETGMWNARALQYQQAGDPMAYTRALMEIVNLKAQLTTESNKDVS